jgi:hypothetical protein
LFQSHGISVPLDATWNPATELRKPASFVDLLNNVVGKHWSRSPGEWLVLVAERDAVRCAAALRTGRQSAALPTKQMALRG